MASTDDVFHTYVSVYQPADVWEMYRDRLEFQRVDRILREMLELLEEPRD